MKGSNQDYLNARFLLRKMTFIFTFGQVMQQLEISLDQGLFLGTCPGLDSALYGNSFDIG